MKSNEPKKQLVPDRLAKVTFLLTDPDARVLGEHNGTDKSFERVTGIHRKTLANWRTSQTAKEEMEVAAIESIAKCFHFTERLKKLWLAGTSDDFKAAWPTEIARALAKKRGEAEFNFEEMKGTLLARLAIETLEVAAGREIGSGRIPVAKHGVVFEQLADSEDGRKQFRPNPHEPQHKAESMVRFADVRFPNKMVNDLGLPSALSLNASFDQWIDEARRWAYHVAAFNVQFSIAEPATAHPDVGRRTKPSAIQNGLHVPEKRMMLRHIQSSGRRPSIEGTICKGPIGALTIDNAVEVYEVVNGTTVTATLWLETAGIEIVDLKAPRRSK